MSPHIIATAAIMAGACVPRAELPLGCRLAPVHVLDGNEGIPEDWPEHAMRRAYLRVGRGTACRAMGDVEVWLRYHRGAPMVCVESDYGSCTVQTGARVHYVEVDVTAVRPGGAESVYEIVHHELMHVVLRRMGVNGSEHHQMMQSWHIETTNRRRTP